MLLDTYVLYKKFVDAGFPKDQAKIIINAAFQYEEAIIDIFDKEYDKLLKILGKSDLDEYQAELVARIIKGELLKSICTCKETETPKYM